MVLAALTAVAVSMPFESLFLQVRQHVLEAKSQADASQIQAVSRDVRGAEWEVKRLRRGLDQLRWRARQPQPNPFLRSEAQNLVWDLRRLANDLWRAEHAARRLVQNAQKNPDLVAPARQLEWTARDLRSETRWLESDGRWAAMDLRRAGLSFEAMDIEREIQTAERHAAELEQDASALLRKVQ